MREANRIGPALPQAPRPGADAALEVVDLLLFQARERLLRREWDGVMMLLGVAGDIIEKVDDEAEEENLSEAG